MNPALSVRLNPTGRFAILITGFGQFYEFTSKSNYKGDLMFTVIFIVLVTSFVVIIQ